MATRALVEQRAIGNGSSSSSMVSGGGLPIKRTQGGATTPATPRGDGDSFYSEQYLGNARCLPCRGLYLHKILQEKSKNTCDNPVVVYTIMAAGFGLLGPFVLPEPLLHFQTVNHFCFDMSCLTSQSAPIATATSGRGPRERQCVELQPKEAKKRGASPRPSPEELSGLSIFVSFEEDTHEGCPDICGLWTGWDVVRRLGV